ncbi:M13 family metallopeptidase [Lactobacillus gigeriorum]|uniref:Endopeptidase O n=1 Tax=Lactobacillus gigeriorum DSM 23908 = CRBIP 24.85 TaxID=1423751 RepID=I7JZD3_9LACO|nr:M13 family metallopeptidase [Lactobacillus gigeriorum]KRN13245.1 endopeptidase O [Lactobacillus gigeriorum DSM 23908 = CRBIP 24.85]CCI86200.1 Endopeptidase O [Lactobacillus gigeriorum DSM 23908 = CRBIP 24.85]
MKRYFAVRGGVGDLTKPDVNARPQDNLYLAVNSAWQAQAEIPEDKVDAGINDELDTRIEKKLINDLNEILEQTVAVPKVPNFDKAVKLYQLAKDFTRRDKEAAEPIQEDLKALLSLKDFKELVELAGDLNNTYLTLPFSFSVEADMKNTKVNVLNFAGPGTFLPDTTSYEAEDATSLLEIYRKQTLHLLAMAGVAEDQVKTLIEAGFAFDKKLAKVVKSTEEWSDYPAAYNPVSYDKFVAKFESFPMASFLEEILPTSVERVIVQEPRFLDSAEELVNPDNFKELKGWMLIRFINGAAGLLSQEFREAAFPFAQALSGQPKLIPQERHAYYIANGSFSEVIGIYYGQKYFGQDAKADVTDMINKMIGVYEDRIANNTWLSDETKKKAIVKLRSLVLKIGYPEKNQAIYDLLEIDPNKSLYENETAMSKVMVKYQLDQLTKPVDRSVWLMPANMNNACYDPQRNDITFPAGILQAPFYDLHQSRGQNYGGIGATIAHEISHAFDNNGAKFDELGNMTNWWTDEDYAEFNRRTQAAIDLYDGLEYGPAKLNGRQIVAENIADLGGLTCAIQANKGDQGEMTDLFENYARSWAQKQRPEAIKTEVAVDVHAPQPTRVNIPSQCQPEFYETYQVTPEDGMWLEPEKRVTIW